MSTPIYLKLYYKVKYYQIVMMKRRGFIIPEDEQLIINSPLDSIESYNRFKLRYLPTDGRSFLQDNLSSLYHRADINKGGPTKVIFVREEDESKEEILTDTTNVIKSLISRDPDIRNIILITRVRFRSTNFNELLSLVSYNIQIFLHSELFYDPTQHQLQPEFELLSLEESKKFLAQSPDTKNIKNFCFDDPVIKFLGGTFNQVVKVTRTLSYIAQVQYTVEHRIITKQSIFEFIKKEAKKKV